LLVIGAALLLQASPVIVVLAVLLGMAWLRRHPLR